MTYKGTINDIPMELFNDAIMFSLFYIGLSFSNKNAKNYIMPFTHNELGCGKHDLNILYPQDDTKYNLFNQDEIKTPFDFRKFLAQFEFSKEAKDLYSAALKVFRYYHQNNEYKNKDWNDSFYDITNTIMGKDLSLFKNLEKENDTRITKVKTAKGLKSFRLNTLKYVVSSKDLPIFENFFAVREVLARKINKELVESGILLWERENIF